MLHRISVEAHPAANTDKHAENPPMVVGTAEASTAGMPQWTWFSYSGTKVFIEQEVPALTRIVNGQREHARMDLVCNLNGSATYLDVAIIAPFSTRCCSQHPPRSHGQES